MRKEPRPTFTVGSDTVLIDVRGVPSHKGFLYVPNDQGLVLALLEAMHKGSLPRSAMTIQSGGGVYIAYFYKEDTDKVIEWLKERADLVDEHPEHNQ